MELELRSITPADEPALRSFECAVYREEWTRDVQELIRESLPYSLSRDRLEALGLWNGDTLIALIAWRAEGQVWYSALLAVATGHQRHGYGQRLKIELLSRAQQAGMDAVYSLIDWDNDTAIALNRRLGAVIVPDPEAPHQLMIATIKLR